MPSRLSVLIGLATLLGLGIALLPWIIQSIMRLLLWPRYSLCVVGGTNVPRKGPVLIVANHVSWIDGFVLAATVPRLGGKALVNAQYIDWPVFGFVARRSGLIPVPATGPRAQRAVIEAVRAAFDRGECVGIFPEAQLSRNGFLGPFYRGLELMLKDREHIPVVPAYLDNLWGSVFSFSGGRFLWKRPRGRRRRVIVAFGPPIEPPVTAFAARQAVQAMSVMARRHARGSIPPPETIDYSLPHLETPEFGLITASTPNYDQLGIRQTGYKPSSVGQAIPGVAVRVVDDLGRPLPDGHVGHLEAFLPGHDAWISLPLRGSLDREGFVFLAVPETNSAPTSGL